MAHRAGPSAFPQVRTVCIWLYHIHPYALYTYVVKEVALFRGARSINGCGV